MLFCHYESDYDYFDINESQARIEEEYAFYDEIEEKRKKMLADDWGDKWDYMYSDDRSVTESLR